MQRIGSRALDQSFVFLVEDDADLRETLQDVLRSEGYLVESASDGCEALDRLRQIRQPPHVILLDWMMPRMDGAQFCREWKIDPGLASIPVVLLTADGRVEEKVASTGVSGGVAKPVDIDVLLAAIEKYKRS